MNDNKYELRKLCAKDIFVMVKIISKIGITEFKKCFEAPAVARKIQSKAKIFDIGMAAMLEISGTCLENLPKCEKDIYSFLADLSGMKSEEIAELGMPEFAEMIEAVVTKEEFRDFFTVVSKYFGKTGKRG